MAYYKHVKIVALSMLQKKEKNMKLLNKFLDEKVLGLAEKIQEIKILTALMEGFIRTSPVTLGYALLSIIITGFDLAGITEKYGLAPHFTALSIATTGILVLFAIYSIASAYAQRIDTHPMNSAMISLASFMILMPFTETVVQDAITGFDSIQYGINTDYLGSKGILLAMVVALVIPQFYKKLSKSKLSFKLPASVPPMIQESLTPMIFVGIIFITMLLVRIGFAATPYGNVFDFFDQIMSKPVRAFIGNPFAMMIVLTLTNLFWFFGIHNAVLQGPLSFLSITLVLANIGAQQQGLPMPYVATSIVSGAMLNSGAMFGLILLLLRSKSEQYKAITKLSLVPAIFNITEPIMFGIPIILNPIYFIPTVFAPVISGLVAWVSWATFLGQYTFNPAMSLLPFVIPKAISGFLSAGWQGLVMWIIVTITTLLVWYPFVKVGDKQALKEEQDTL